MKANMKNAPSLFFSPYPMFSLFLPAQAPKLGVSSFVGTYLPLNHLCNSRGLGIGSQSIRCVLSTPNRATPESDSVIKTDKPPQNHTNAPKIDPQSTISNTPADYDANNFKLAPSVMFWRDWKRVSPIDDLQHFLIDTESSASTKDERWPSLRPNSRVAWGLQPQSTTDAWNSAKYWGYHTLRTGFFVLQAVSGLQYSQQAINKFNKESASNVQTKISHPWEKLSMKLALGMITETFQMFRQDQQNVRNGYYKEPYDMNPRHRQFNPVYIITNTSRFLQEAREIILRRSTEKAEDIWYKSVLAPQYYNKTWHYQTDGWLSSKSANVYESTTETLFLGCQDAMQRQTLVPLHKYFTQSKKDTTNLNILEMACGTGRFATFLKDNYPHAHITLLDLSPFYLEKARENMDYYWSNFRDKSIPKDEVNVSYLNAPAENTRLPDASFDAITCIYLFHEMNQQVRASIVREMYRVLKPNGIVVLTDSFQLGDRPELDPTMRRFGKLNEPEYEEYAEADLGKLFIQHGFQCYEKEMANRSKVLSFIKPGTD